MSGDRRFLSMQAFATIITAVVLTALTAVGVAEYRGLRSIEAETAAYVQDAARLSGILAQIDAEIGYGGLIHNYKNLVISRDLDLYDQVLNHYQTFIARAAALRAESLFPEEAIDALDTLIKTMSQYRDASEQIWLNAGGTSSAEELDSSTGIDDAAAIEAREELTKILTELSIEQRTSVSRSVASAFVTLFALLGATAAGVIAALALLFRSLNRKFRAIESATREIAAGDLRREIEVHSNDAVGRLVANLEEAMDGFAGMVEQIKHSADSNGQTGTRLAERIDETLSATSEISANMQSIITQVEQLASQIGTASASVEQIVATIRGVAGLIERQREEVSETSASIEEMDASIRSVAAIVDTKSGATERLSEVTGEGHKRVSETIEIIEGVGENVTEVSKMISIINAIAAQTNLLSVNAAIEAAHAGDAGKGFSVVAEEIRNLAETTAVQAKEITRTLDRLVEQIRKAQTSSLEDGEAFEEIERGVREVSESFNEITASTGELAIGSGEVLNSISSLNQISTEIAEGSIEVSSGAEEIGRALQSIKSISEETRVAVREIGIGSNDIARAAAEMSEVSGQSREELRELVSQVGRFRT